jgi:hypothetical protein
MKAASSVPCFAAVALLVEKTFDTKFQLIAAPSTDGHLRFRRRTAHGKIIFYQHVGDKPRRSRPTVDYQ